MLLKINWLNKLVLISLIGMGILFSILGLTLADTKKIVENPQPVIADVKGVATEQASTTPRPTILKPKIKISPTPTSTKQPTQTAATPAPITQGNSSSNSTQTQPSQAPTSTATPAPTSAPTVTNQVTLSINGGSSFTVSVNQDGNQCDVLSSALSQGKINSLNMRYDKSYETNAVYQINGIGKENAVWWVYTINGKSPSQGCSHIQANNNDHIEWKYTGP